MSSVRGFFIPDHEKLVCVMLNVKNVVIGIDIVSVGTLTSSLASGREIFKSAILLNAAAIILSHNHPAVFAGASKG